MQGWERGDGFWNNFALNSAGLTKTLQKIHMENEMEKSNILFFLTIKKESCAKCFKSDSTNKQMQFRNVAFFS